MPFAHIPGVIVVIAARITVIVTNPAFFLSAVKNDAVKDGYELIGIFSRILDEHRRRVAIALVKVLADEETTGDGMTTRRVRMNR